jgi:putative salt-induced outer membrane protein YdiY
MPYLIVFWCLFVVLIDPIDAISIIEPKVIKENQGLSADLSFAFEYSNGDSDSEAYSVELSSHYGKNKYLHYALASAGLEKDNGSKSQDQMFVHLRHLREMPQVEWFNFEVFGQLGRDNIKNIDRRDLLGTGFRYHQIHKQQTFFVGLGGFYFHEERKGGFKENDLRINVYLSFKSQLTESAKLICLAYYQPKVDEFSDFDIVAQAGLSNDLSQRLQLELKAAYSHNETPALSKARDNTNLTIGLNYKLR